MRRGASLLELLVVLAILGVLMGLILPAVQSARRRARQELCANQLRQLGLGWTQLLDSNPQALDGNLGPYARVSWRVLVLPYLEQINRHGEYRLDLPWDAPENDAVRKAMPGLFACPAAAGLPAGCASYDAPFLTSADAAVAPPVTRRSAPRLLAVETPPEYASPWVRPTVDPLIAALVAGDQWEEPFARSHDIGYHELRGDRTSFQLTDRYPSPRPLWPTP